MTQEQQRIALAEAQGIYVCPACNHEIDPNCCHCGAPMKSHGYSDGHSGVPMGCTCSYHKAGEMKAASPACPDYLHDLNALAAARDQLITTTERRIDWSNALRAVVGLTCDRRNKAGHPLVSDLDMLFATPAQLAEALLKTLKLWIKP